MPIGIMVNACAIVIGGLIGTFLGNKLSSDFKEKLNMIFGVCAMTMGVSSISLMQNMPAVVFAVIIGTCIGLAVHLGDKINAGGKAMQSVMGRFLKQQHTGLSEEEFSSTLVTVIVLFCASGTGIYGSIVSGMTGDHSILYLLAGLIFPLTTPVMINDFKACGGVLLLATGFRMIRVKMFPVADMIPAMILAMPVSWLWTSFVLPLVS